MPGLLSKSTPLWETQPMPEDLMGQAEIAALLGVTKQRAQQLYKAGKLPEPLGVVAMGPVWLKEDIETWARETGRIE